MIYSLLLTNELNRRLSHLTLALLFAQLTNRLTYHQQRVSVDENFSQFKSVVSSVPRGSVLGPSLFILYTADMWNDLEKKINLYANDNTFYAEVESP